jgi:hypothetical protein
MGVPETSHEAGCVALAVILMKDDLPRCMEARDADDERISLHHGS